LQSLDILEHRLKSKEQYAATLNLFNKINNPELSRSQNLKKKIIKENCKYVTNALKYDGLPVSSPPSYLIFYYVISTKF
jgi:hypothetical protein